MSYLKLEKIKMSLLENGDISEEEQAFVYASLLKKNILIITTACSILISQKNEKIDQILEQFYTFPKLTKKIMIPHLACTSYYKAIKFLFEFLENTSIPELISTTSICLAKTEYPVIPYLLDYLEKASPPFQEKLLIIIEIIGLDQFKAPLALLPYIPKEPIFRRAFSDSIIDEIKKKSS